MEKLEIEMEKLELKDLRVVVHDLDYLLNKLLAQNDPSLNQEIAFAQRDLNIAKPLQIRAELLEKLQAIERETDEKLAKMNMQSLKYLRENKHLYPDEYEHARAIKAEISSKYFPGIGWPKKIVEGC